jgi:hypothetical protein
MTICASRLRRHLPSHCRAGAGCGGTIWSAARGNQPLVSVPPSDLKNVHTKGASVASTRTSSPGTTYALSLQALSADGQADICLLGPAMKLMRASLATTRASVTLFSSQPTGLACAATAQHVKKIAARERAGRTRVKEGIGMNPGWLRFPVDVASPSAVVQTSAMFPAVGSVLACETLDRERMRAADPACKLPAWRT